MHEASLAPLHHVIAIRVRTITRVMLQEFGRRVNADFENFS